MRNTQAKTIDRTEAMSRTVGKPAMLKPRMYGHIIRVGNQISINFKSNLVEFSSESCRILNVDDNTFGMYMFLEEGGGPGIWTLACRDENKDAYKFVKSGGHQRRFANAFLVKTIKERLQLPDEPHIIHLEVGEKDESCGFYPLRLKRHEE